MSQHSTIAVRRRDVIRAAAGGLAVGSTGLAMTAVIAEAYEGEHRYIVLADSRSRPWLENSGFDVLNSLADDSVFIVTGPPDRQADLARVPGVQHAARDVELRLDETLNGFAEPITPQSDSEGDSPLFWNFQWEKQVIDIEGAHERATGAGSRIVIVDTGIQPGHPDLSNLDEEASIAFLHGEPIVAGEPTDVQGHGTMVGGIAAAQGIGVLGTAPDAELVSIRIYTEAMTTTLIDILLALNYAADIGADAINLSFGTFPLPPQVNASAIRGVFERMMNYVIEQGSIPIAAAGNSAANLQQGGMWMLFTGLAGAIGASATGADDLLTFYSNYGTNAIDIGAPGGGMVTAVKSYCGIMEFVLEGRIANPGEDTQVCFADPDAVFPEPVFDPDEAAVCYPCTTSEFPFPLNGILSTGYDPSTDVYGYAWQGGTSFAAPHVAGLVALVRELDSQLNPRRVENAIKRAAENAVGRSDPALGAGRINAASTLELLG